MTVTTDDREVRAEDIDNALDYQQAHTRVSVEPPNKPADYKPPVDVTKIDPLANIPNDDLLMSLDDKIRSVEFAAEQLAKTLDRHKALLVQDIIPYLGRVMRREMNAEDVALAIKVERTTAWRWLKRIDPILVKSRRAAVNPDQLSDDQAIAVYVDFSYNNMTRVALSEKYDLPDKAIQSLIARGRDRHQKRLSQHHKNTKDAAR